MKDLLKPIPIVSFLITVHAGKELLTRTLDEIDRCGLRDDEYEIFLVKGEKPIDADRKAVARTFPLIAMMVQAYNRGPVTLQQAIGSARGRFVVLLHEGTFPRAGSIARMMMHFDADAKLGCCVFTVLRADGSHEGAVWPNVFLSAASGFRRRAFEELTAIPEKLSPSALEYDLSLKLLAGGWEIKSFDDIFAHRLDEVKADPMRWMRQDVRDHLWLASRYFPRQWVVPYLRDWLRRYRMVAAETGGELGFYGGLIAGVSGSVQPTHRQPIDDATFEKLVRMDETASRLKCAKEQHGLKTMLLVDFGMNLLAYWTAARKARVRIIAVADERLAGKKRNYRGIPIVSIDEARAMTFDAAVISTLSSADAAARRSEWREFCGRPVIDLFEDQRYITSAAGRLASAARRIAARSA